MLSYTVAAAIKSSVAGKLKAALTPTLPNAWTGPETVSGVCQVSQSKPLGPLGQPLLLSLQY